MIGILAYGSLIEDPGEELQAVITDRTFNVQTPFSIEFARSSRSRGGAPTLIPVEEGGGSVNAVILVLNENVIEDEALNMLWRRETRGKGRYVRAIEITPNTVTIERLVGLAGIDVVLYTKIGRNIDNLEPRTLATLAIESARSQAGSNGKDGISYLISVKRSGIVTPLMADYEAEILRQTNTPSLEDALSQVRDQT